MKLIPQCADCPDLLNRTTDMPHFSYFDCKFCKSRRYSSEFAIRSVCHAWVFCKFVWEGEEERYQRGRGRDEGGVGKEGGRVCGPFLEMIL